MPADQPIVTHAQAKAAGLVHYFTGKPCKRGHVSERQVSGKSCIACRNIPENLERQKASRRASYWKNPEANRTVARAAYAANPEYQKEWAKNNPDKVKAHQRKTAAKHREKLALKANEHRKKNLPVYANNERRRRARKRAAGGDHTVEQVIELAKRQRHRCANPVCRVSILKGYEVDHIVALSKGGSNDFRNIQLLCKSCNRSKHDKDPIVWMQEKGMLL